MSQTVVTASDQDAGLAKGQERHPSGLYILFATEMWERFGFYTAAAIMTLYLQRGGFGWSKTEATTLWSNYLMFVYATPLIGGWLADKFLGYRRSVLLGGIFFVAGYALLGLGSVATYYLALALSSPATASSSRTSRRWSATSTRRAARSRTRPTTSSTWGSTSARCWRRSSRKGALQLLAGSDVLEMAKKGEALSAEQAASLRAGFLAAFYAAAAGMTLGTVILRGLLPEAGGRRAAACSAQGGRPGRRRGHRGPPAEPRSSHGDRSGPRVDADHGAPGHLRHRDRLLDGLPPERQHDDLLGRREHGVERLGRRLQRDQSVLDRRPLDPPGQRLELAAEEGARAVDADQDGDRDAAHLPGVPDPVRRGEVGRRPDVRHRRAGAIRARRTRRAEGHPAPRLARSG